MGQFSVEKTVLPGSVLSGNQQTLYLHDDEGPDDMPAHIRAALGASQLSIPVEDGRPALGIWQGIYVFEHRRSRRRRTVTLHLIGE